MDWQSLIAKTKSITDTAKPFLEKAQPLMNKAKTYGSSAVAFVGKQIENTPIFLKTEEEYNIHASAKRSICIAYDSRDTISESIRLLMPLWATQAWTDAAELKYLEISTNEDLAKTLKVSGPLETRISYMGEEYARYHTLDEVKNWWKARCYKKHDDTTNEAPIPTTTEDGTPSTDPLAWVTQTQKK